MDIEVVDILVDYYWLMATWRQYDVCRYCTGL